MIQRTGKRSNGLGVLASVSILASSILINPWTSFDAINVPRLIVVLAMGSCSIFYILKIERSSWATLLKSKQNLLIILAGSAYIVSLCSALFFSGTGLGPQFYGTQGRFMGFIPLASLASILILFSLRGYECTLKVVSPVLFLSGLVNLIYGYIQFLGLDPVDWQNPYGPIVGTLGNPNFMSSYLGLFGIFNIFIMFRHSDYSGDILFTKLSSFILFLSVVFLIQQTKSIQGFFVLLFGSAIVLAGRFKFRFLKIRYFLGLILILVLPIMSIGLAGYGPLGGLLYQSTLEVRLFFWRAALRMIADKPLTGFGLDSFGNWYTTFRDENSASVYGPALLTNSAHNVFLDMGAFGGLPLLITYLALSLVITSVGFKHLLSKQLSQPLFTLSFALWIGYLAQALISIHHLGLSLLGNLFGAISFSLATHNLESKKYFLNLKFRQIGLLSTLASGLIGLVIAFPIARNDVDFRSAIYEKEGQRIFEVVNRWPKNDFQLVVASRLFYLGNNPEVGRELARLALATNQRSIDALKLLLQDNSLGEGEKSEIASRIKKIDPFGTN